MSNYCTIYAEMHMIFDNDFDVYSITKRLGIAPTECKSRNETRMSPLTDKPIEGFWTLKTEEKEERDLGVVLNELMGNIFAKLPDIKKSVMKMEEQLFSISSHFLMEIVSLHCILKEIFLIL